MDGQGVGLSWAKSCSSKPAEESKDGVKTSI